MKNVFIRDQIFNLDRAVRTAQGYLKVNIPIGKVGILEYMNRDGSKYTQFRPRDELNRDETLESFKNIPVTREHPPVPVTSKNAKVYSRGLSDSDIFFDDDMQTVTVTITDSQLISEIETGVRNQISCGYFCDLKKPDEGESYNGDSYDYKQTNIRGNHIAIVRAARAGKDLSINLDSDESSLFICDSGDKQPIGVNILETIVIDGVEYKVDAKVKESFEANASKLEELTKDSEDAKSKLDQFEKDSADLKKNLDQVEAERDELKKQNEMNKDSAEQLASKVSEKIALISKVKPFLKDKKEDELINLDSAELVKQAVQENNKELNLDGKSDDYIQARFDIMVESKQITKDAADKIVNKSKKEEKKDELNLDSVREESFKNMTGDK